jgi:hypothetical protein
MGLKAPHLLLVSTSQLCQWRPVKIMATPANMLSEPIITLDGDLSIILPPKLLWKQRQSSLVFYDNTVALHEAPF